jgi:hypothetical protein
MDRQIYVVNECIRCHILPSDIEIYVDKPIGSVNHASLQHPHGRQCNTNSKDQIKHHTNTTSHHKEETYET